ncbi:stage III sporulation AC/AD family protein [Eubacteriales bacterium OttesenSCG-928-N13]|nr:stage III sporulation AC/AD family protein [Eubacteriales bacterium OttesenSCG-928-N13]
MEIVRIVLLCVAAAMIAMALRTQRPEMAAMVAMAAGLVALMMSLGAVSSVVGAFSQLSERAGLSGESVSLMLRACGISLLCEFASGLCQDAGEGALAQRIEFGGRVALLAMSVPLLVSLSERVIEWLPA